MTTKFLLACGILSSLFYAVINIVVPFCFEGYSFANQTVSELSAINAPTRSMWIPLGVIYVLLFAAFGFGVITSSNGNQKIRTAGILIVIYCAINIYWPPMHLRGSGTSLTDTLHIVWASIAVLFMLLMMGFAAAGLGSKFRAYTIASVILLLCFGFLTGLDAPNIPLNLSTPWLGIWERILIGIFLVWVIVFSTVLIKKQSHQSRY